MRTLTKKETIYALMESPFYFKMPLRQRRCCICEFLNGTCEKRRKDPGQEMSCSGKGERNGN
jgi:hypothetical protein